MLALTGEVGELAECFQWRSDQECTNSLQAFDEKEKHHVEEEIADVLIYTVRLAEVCGIDLGKATERKFGMNAKKYPVAQVRGSRKKYTEYSTTEPGERENGLKIRD